MMHVQRKAKKEENHARLQSKEEHQWIKKKKTGARKMNDRRLTTHGQGTAKKYEGQEEATSKSKDGHGRKARSVDD